MEGLIATKPIIMEPFHQVIRESFGLIMTRSVYATRGFLIIPWKIFHLAAISFMHNSTFIHTEAESQN